MLQTFTYSIGLAFTGRSAACTAPTVTKAAAQPSRMFFDIGNSRGWVAGTLVLRSRTHNDRRVNSQPRRRDCARVLQTYRGRRCAGTVWEAGARERLTRSRSKVALA